MESQRASILVGDCRDVMATMEAASVDAIVTDPPYFRVKDDAWDNQWRRRGDFFEWMGAVADEWRRVLKPNGSLYCFASPHHATGVEVEIAKRFHILNRIVWIKEEGTYKRNAPEGLRRFFPQTEHVIFAEQVGQDTGAMTEAGYNLACDRLRGQVFDPIREYIASEWERAGLKPKDADTATGMRYMASRHYFPRSQWYLPTAEHYAAMQAYANQNGGDYLRREYEDLRREYEDLRRPFFANRDAWYTDVWRFPTVSNYRGKHPAEKPVEMLRYIVEVSTRPGDVVLDTFCGSGTTGVACAELGRHFIGIDLDERWVARTRDRIAMAGAQQPLPLAGD